MNIDKMGARYEPLMNGTIPYKVVLSHEEDNCVFWLKAFKSNGMKVIVDGRYYYPHVADTIILEFGCECLSGSTTETFDFFAHRGGGYGVTYSTRYRIEGVDPKHFEIFSKLMDYFEKMVDLA
jgi:hypothetical protein